MATDVADDGQIAQAVELGLEIGAELANMAADVLALHQGDVGERGSAGHRVT